jgi:CHAD domain-containing protein
MPAENFLLSNWEREVDSLKKHLKKFSTERIEVIHKFRINIKKLRAYLKLYLLISKRKEDRELFRETENLFSVFGEHRNLELNKNSAVKIFPGDKNLSDAFVNWLEERQAKLEIDSRLKQYDPGSLDELSAVMKDSMLNMDGEVLMKEISDINHHYLKKAKKHMHHFGQNFHQIRKELKTIFYLSKISFPSAGFSKAEIDKLEEILELLGSIQDNEVTKDLLHQFHGSVSNGWEIHLVERSISNIVLQKEEELVKVQKKAEGFLKEKDSNNN